MVGVIDTAYEGIVGAHHSVIDYFPPHISAGIGLVLFAVFIVFVSLFIWQFYNTLSKKDLINLSLKKYNSFQHPQRRKFFAVLLYLFENAFIMPFLIVVWLAALAIILLLIAKDSDVSYILTLSASLVLAIRLLAYTNKNLSKDLAKLFPFITLSVFLLSPQIVNFAFLGDRLSEIPLLFDSIFYFLLTIFVVEILLRIVDTIVLVIKNEEDNPWNFPDPVAPVGMDGGK
ncbi:hypothetical protein COU54_05785 [Candidatus Pacearchaeota archaeon CG10_big_fil_rev_8_21_14_0_10_31_24]|nr:MAG: hypothetical protein COU54_05785 [Candidatus Pacearchaeota archaeon CG10_big_fil_rev_8_21_14_0_10_31_24]